MAKTLEQKSILIITKKPDLREDIRSAFKKHEEFNLLENMITSDLVLPRIGETRPDLILLDFEFQQKKFFDLVDEIAAKYPLSAVIVLLPESEMVNSERVILSGARAFILYPFKQDNLITTVKRVLELIVRNQSIPFGAHPDASQKPKNTFFVFSPKGGAGTTTVATNLAISLHNNLREDVLLIDGKHLFGHVALCLNLRSANSIKDLISHIGMLDQRLIKQVVVRHISGIHVLPSPNSISEGQGIRPDDLYRILQALQATFPTIIIDGGNNLNENTVTYMDASDNILLVLNPDLASLRDARQFMEITQTLSYPPEKTLLILNLTGRKADVKKEEIEQILNKKIFGKIPADENLALSSLNEGVPIVLKSPNHSISRAFVEISKALVKIINASKAEYNKKTSKESNEILKKSSKLG